MCKSSIYVISYCVARYMSNSTIIEAVHVVHLVTLADELSSANIFVGTVRVALVDHGTRLV